MLTSNAWVFRAACVLALAVSAAAGCNARRAQLRQCTFNSECEAPLICAEGFCREQCRTDRDCPASEVCARAAVGAVGYCLDPDAGTPEDTGTDVTNTVDGAIDAVAGDVATGDVSGTCAPSTTRACYTSAPRTLGIGRCRAGTQTCTGAGTWGACVGEVGPTVIDICANMVDDNCDGRVDEDCGSCTPLSSRACYTGPAATRMVGACRDGTQTCDSAGNWPAACSGEVVPRADICFGAVDENCDGRVNESCYRAQVFSVPFEDVCALTGAHRRILPNATGDIRLSIPETGGMPAITIPFPVRYWGRAMPPPFTVSSAGWLSFVPVGPGSSTDGIPHTRTPNSTVAVAMAYSGLRARTSATGICYAVTGTAPDRRFIVQWEGYSLSEFGSGATTVTMEIIVNEAASGADNVIDIAYARGMAVSGGCNCGTLCSCIVAAGLEDPTGTLAVLDPLVRTPTASTWLSVAGLLGALPRSVRYLPP